MSRRLLFPLLALLVIADVLLLAPLLGKRLFDAAPNDDLIGFLDAARRMRELGTPYLPMHLDASLPLRPGWELIDAYVYSPLIAQMVTPLIDLSHALAWQIWSIASFLALVVAGILGARAAGARVTPLGVLAGVLLCAPVMTVASSFWHGRSEPFVALAVGAALVGIAPAAAATFAAILRLPAGAFGLPLLVAATSRRRFLAQAILAGAVIVAVGALFAPQAWRDYLVGGALLRTIGGNLGIGIYDDAPHAFAAFLFFYVGAIPETYDAAADLIALGPTASALIHAVRLLELVAGVGLLVWSARIARDTQRRHAAIAAALVGGLFMGGLFWDYHNLPLLPIAVATALVGGPGVRTRLVAAALFGIGSLLVTDVAMLLADANGESPAIFWPLRRIASAGCSVGVGLLILDAARRSRLPVPKRQRARRLRGAG